MGTRYTQLTLVERKRIFELLELGKSQAEVAFALGRNRGTVSRELKRNRWDDGFYFAHTAQKMSNYRRFKASSRLKIDPKVWKKVVSKLEVKWSPEQISERLKLEEQGRISASTIYTWIWLDRKAGGTLYQHLRISRRKRKKRNLPLRQRGPIQNEKSIKKRPKIVENRKRIGDLEGDTIHFSKDRKSGLLTVTDRVSKVVRIRKLKRRQSDLTAVQTIKAMATMPEKPRTLTLDRGAEFARHAKIEKRAEIKVYFADPYTASQRGSIENQNGLIRQFFPLDVEISELSGSRIRRVQTLLNNRPRKSLGYLTPLEYENQKMLVSAFLKT